MSVGNQLTIQDYETFVTNSEKTKKAKGNKTLSSLENQHNRVLYDQYVREAELGNQKNAALEKNAASKSQSLRDNAVLTEKAKRYLEQKAVLEGNANSGIAQSNLIDLYSQSAQNRANIGASYDQKESDLLLEYDKAINESKTNTNKSLFEIENAKEQQEELDKQEHTAMLAQKLADYEAKVSRGESFDGEETLLDDYEKFKDSLNEEKDYDLIQRYDRINDQKTERMSIVETDEVDIKSTISLDDVTKDSFGEWHVDTTSALINYFRNGDLDRLVSENGDKAIYIDLDGNRNGERWVAYKNGMLHIVNDPSTIPENAFKAWMFDDGGIWWE